MFLSLKKLYMLYRNLSFGAIWVLGKLVFYVLRLVTSKMKLSWKSIKVFGISRTFLQKLIQNFQGHSQTFVWGILVLLLSFCKQEKELSNLEEEIKLEWEQLHLK